MPAIDPQKALVHPQTKKKKNPEWIVNSQPQHIKIRLFGK
jgi:hypothetical protein